MRTVISAYRFVVSKLTCPSHPRITLISTPASAGVSPLLRPTADATSQERVRDLILEAYAETEAAAVAASA